MFKNSFKLSIAGAVLLLLTMAQGAWAGPAGFTLHNVTGAELHAVYIGSSDEADWGDNLLDEDETIVDGGDIEVEFEPGEDRETWDMRVEDSEGNALEFTELNLLEATTVILKDDNTAIIK
jgi:hypothetical protein